MTSDRRSTPATERVALTRLKGQLDRPAWTEGEAARVAVPLTDLCRAPDGARDRQLLWGADVTVIDAEGPWRFVEAAADGYCGWVEAAALTAELPPITHRVAAPATHVYPRADMKTRELAGLSLGARLAVAAIEGPFARLATGGFVPLVHIADAPDSDPAAVAQRFLGTPYLWGGNSRAGIDCSGLAQAALLACAIPCPGDSDQQWQAVGRRLEAGEGYRRGDLLFWPGHVAMALSAERMIHATARFMAVVEEGIDETIARIDAAGEGPLMGARRPAG